MPELIPLELKTYLPAKDFERSIQFYQDIGFTLCWNDGGVALMHYGPCGSEYAKISFLLQNYYVEAWAENLQMHLMVSDVNAWWTHVQAKQLPERYGVKINPPVDHENKIRDLDLRDPSGVLWRITQFIE